MDDYFDKFFSAAYSDELIAGGQTKPKQYGQRLAQPIQKPQVKLSSSNIGREKRANRPLSGTNKVLSEPKPKKKKQKKKKSKEDAALVEHLTEKWRNDSDRDTVKQLFGRIDESFQHEGIGLAEKRKGAQSADTARKQERTLQDVADTDISRWISLRESYIVQLKSMMEQNVMATDDGEPTEELSGGPRSTVPVANLLLLLASLRRVTLRIVSTFEVFCKEYTARKNKKWSRRHEQAAVALSRGRQADGGIVDQMAMAMSMSRERDRNSIVQLTEYITAMATSLNWLYEEHGAFCREVLHLDPTYNPFLSIYRLDGACGTLNLPVDTLYSSAKRGQVEDSATDGKSIPLELAMDAEELETANHLSNIVHALCGSSGSGPRNPSSASLQQHLQSSVSTGTLDAPLRSSLKRDTSSSDTGGSVPAKRSPMKKLVTGVRFAMQHHQTVDEDIDRANSNDITLFGSTESPIRKKGQMHYLASSSSQSMLINSIASPPQTGHRRGSPTMNDSIDDRITSALAKVVDDEEDAEDALISTNRRKAATKRNIQAMKNVVSSSRILSGGLGASKTKTSPFFRTKPLGDSPAMPSTNAILADNVGKLFKQKEFFNKWRAAYRDRTIVQPLIANREYRMKRMVFQQLQVCLWQNHEYRHLVQKHELKLLAHVFRNGLRVHHEWAQRVKAFYRKQMLKMQKKYFLKLSTFAINNYDNRRFLLNRRQRYIADGFRCLRNNMKLNRYLLQRRLRTSSRLLFVDHFMKAVCLHRWMRYLVFSRRLERLEELVEDARMKQSLVRWVLHTWAYTPKLTFKQRCEAIRRSIEATVAPIVATGINAIRREVVSASAAIRESASHRYRRAIDMIRPMISADNNRQHGAIGNGGSTSVLNVIVGRKSHSTVHPQLYSPQNASNAKISSGQGSPKRSPVAKRAHRLTSAQIEQERLRKLRVYNAIQQQAKHCAHSGSPV